MPMHKDHKPPGKMPKNMPKDMPMKEHMAPPFKKGKK